MDELACNELVEIITDYLEGRLSTEDAERFELHLLGCDGCAAYLDQMRTTIRLVGEIREEEIPTDAREALLTAFRDWRRR